MSQQFIELAEIGENDRQKLSLLVQQYIEASLNGNRLEFEINSRSKTRSKTRSKKDNKIKNFICNVYKLRYNYLTTLLSGIYSDKNKVKKHALILYSLVVGTDFFYRKLTKKELELMFSDYLIKH